MSKTKENDMICNGGIAPQLPSVLDYYHAYLNSMTNLWYAWAAASGMKYWNDQYWSIVNQINQETK